MSTSSSSASFLWHDYETFGADPRRDRPCQFAALRTDESLNVIDEPLVLYCQPSDDVLPKPEACLITGITPQLALERGLPEPEFAARIHAAMSQPNTCSLGYNSLRFDDEVSRHLFWRTFHDPYSREYLNGNSRFDLMDLMRLTRALRPEGLNWPNHDDGLPSFRLEHLAAANGLDTSRAHDALADVEATIGLARQLREHQPKLWEWALSLRDKHQVDALLAKGEPLVYAGPGMPLQHCATGVVWPLARHPQIPGRWLVWPLAVDPSPYLEMDLDHLRALQHTEARDQRLPLRVLASNRCPMLAPMSVLTEAARQRLALDDTQWAHHRQRLIDAPDFVARLLGLQDQPDAGPEEDPEQGLYARFVARDDQRLCATVRRLAGAELTALGEPFGDHRLNVLLWRYRARWYRASLDEAELTDWQAWRQQRLIDSGALAAYDRSVASLVQSHPEHTEVLTALQDWPSQLALR